MSQTTFTTQSNSGDLISGVAELDASVLTNLTTTPYELIPTPGAGFGIALTNFVFSFRPGATQYTGGNTVTVEYETTGGSITANISSATITAAVGYAQTNQIPVAGTLSVAENEAVQVKSTTTPFATGDGVLRIHYSYVVVEM